MFGFPQMFEVNESVSLQTFVQRSQVGGTKSKWVATDKVMEIPVYELPVETVVVRDKHETTLAIRFEPAAEVLHHDFWVVECHTFFTRETADGESIWNKAVGNRLELAVERPSQFWFDDDGAEANHGVVAGVGSVRFYVNHDVRHCEFLLKENVRLSNL